MIWAIIVGVLLVVGIVLLPTSVHDKEDLFDVGGMFFFTVIILTIAVVCALIFSYIFAQSNSPNSIGNSEKRTELADEVASLNATYECLKDGGTHSVVEIAHYNDLVRQFQDKVAIGQMYRKNPWTNWFASRVWNEFSVDDVKLYTP